MTTTDALVSEPLRVLIADDHVLFRDGLRALLRSAPDTQLVGEATTGEEAIRLAAELQPDVILMDIRMPGMDGIEATRHIVRTSPHIGIIMVTMLEDDHAIFAAMRAGARGYVLKGAEHEEVLRAIRVVGSGEAIFSASIAVRLMDYFAQLRPVATPQVLPELSNREREILELVGQGWKNPQIATHLGLTVKTVRNHIGNILSKLQVADRTQAAIRAREAGLL